MHEPVHGRGCADKCVREGRRVYSTALRKQLSARNCASSHVKLHNGIAAREGILHGDASGWRGVTWSPSFATWLKEHYVHPSRLSMHVTSPEFVVVRVLECDHTVLTFAATLTAGVLDDSWGWLAQGAPAMCPHPSDALTTIPMTAKSAVLHYVCSSPTETSLWSVGRTEQPRRAVFQSALVLLPPRGPVATYGSSHGLLLGLEYTIGAEFGLVLVSRDGLFWTPPANTQFEHIRPHRGFGGLCSAGENGVFGLFTNGEGVTLSTATFDHGDTWYSQTLETPKGCQSRVETVACHTHRQGRVLVGLSGSSTVELDLSKNEKIN